MPSTARVGELSVGSGAAGGGLEGQFSKQWDSEVRNVWLTATEPSHPPAALYIGYKMHLHIQCLQASSYPSFPTNKSSISVQGSQVQVKGIPDIARHTTVTVTPCKDADNFDYPPGLVCAAEDGNIRT